MSKKVACLESWGNEHTFVGSGGDVLAWRRLSCLGTVGSHPGTVRGMKTQQQCVRDMVHDGHDADDAINFIILMGCNL